MWEEFWSEIEWKLKDIKWEIKWLFTQNLLDLLKTFMKLAIILGKMAGYFGIIGFFTFSSWPRKHLNFSIPKELGAILFILGLIYLFFEKSIEIRKLIVEILARILYSFKEILIILIKIAAFPLLCIFIFLKIAIKHRARSFSSH